MLTVGDKLPALTLRDQHGAEKLPVGEIINLAKPAMAASSPTRWASSTATSTLRSARPSSSIRTT